MSVYKILKKGAVARLRNLYKEKRSRKRPTEVIEEMKEMFKSKSALPLKNLKLKNRTVNSTTFVSGGLTMDRTNADQFRTNMKEWMESARKEPIKITRKSGESFVLVRSEIFEQMQLDLARLEGLTANLSDLAQGKTSASTEKATAEIFEKAKKRALSSKRAKRPRVNGKV